MNEDIKRRWVEALRSGQYQQGPRSLNFANQKFCCLGVLCEIAVEDGILVKVLKVDQNVVSYEHNRTPDGQRAFLTSLIDDTVAEWAGLPDDNPETSYDGEFRVLTGWNDSGLADFNRIAYMIEEQL